MYTRHIEVRKNLVFLTENTGIKIETIGEMFPPDVTFYVETENEWWVERDPFNGQEKDEDIKEIALKVFKIAIDTMDTMTPNLEEERNIDPVL